MSKIHIDNFDGWILPGFLSPKQIANLSRNPRLFVLFIEGAENGPPDMKVGTFDRADATFHNSLNIENITPEKAVEWRRRMEEVERGLRGDAEGRNDSMRDWIELHDYSFYEGYSNERLSSVAK